MGNLPLSIIVKEIIDYVIVLHIHICVYFITSVIGFANAPFVYDVNREDVLRLRLRLRLL